LSVARLPYIYQRLFQLAPLENIRLYVTRDSEEAQLKLAFKKWLDGSYAPVIVSAEKGAGITSFLNIFKIKLEYDIKYKRLIIDPTVTSEEIFIKLLQDLFLPERFLNFDDFIKYLNTAENKQIIIVENLQHMYLRSLKGFLALKLLVDIISKTNKNIFWVVSTTLYANEYLSKTIRLNDIFGYEVIFKELKSDQIIELIKKRNSISGYNIIYEIDPEVAQRKEIHKLQFAQQQNLLEKQFFNSLNKFAQSNISLALLFWLSSIKDIKERQIFINADFAISTAPNFTGYPSLCYANNQFYVFWIDQRTLPNMSIFGARVTKQGVVADTSGIEIYTDSASYDCNVAYDGTNFLVVTRNHC